MTSLRESIRHLKNDIIYRYYHFRIDSNDDPYQVVMKKEPYKVLFILSHMRSGSSLLTHILISNPAIKGYGESHIQYQSEADLKSLMYKIYFHNQEFTNFQDLEKLRMNHSYILDKLLHDKKLLNKNLLKLENFYFIFLIREPQRSLMSMLDHKPHWTEKNAVNYYTQRLSSLSEYAQIIHSKERSLFLTHNQLIHETDKTLKSLQSFLKTTEIFSENYEVLNTTGKRNVGDFKENIRSGRIIRKNREINIDISQESLQEAMDAYGKYQLELSQTCTIIDS
ncbi:unknown [Crocosphaera subtropica ATCC 51142]|uniref:Sulfotransferase family protein n=1 Tax=Crocosphaera subtropica (strain ATCC 51142 / BH68) TaxID=43989 RepID=B1WUC2_CROS5|nr:sulfotransferase [Crocosphaera subtropica]ACB53776.1 unknown [Crocosphaera subtropica ATCC 51142]